MRASSLAYTTILSIIPVLAVSFSIFHAFGGLEKLYGTIEPFIIENLAESASEDAMKAIRTFLSNIHAGAIGGVGFVGLIFTCMSLLFTIEKAINQVWKAPMKRTFFQRVSSYWLLITLGPLALAILVGFASSASLPMAHYLPNHVGVFVITAAIFSLTFKYVPHRPLQWMPAITAGAVTALGWNLARAGFAIYTKQVVSYSKIYGSLGAIPLLLLWIYICWVVVLAGAALSAALQGRLDSLLEAPLEPNLEPNLEPTQRYVPEKIQGEVI